MILKPTQGAEPWAAPDPASAAKEKKIERSIGSPFGKRIDDRKKSFGRDGGIRQNKGGHPLEENLDPAIIAMRAAGLKTTGRELTPVKEYAKKDPLELEERPSDIAKRVFEEHGLDFVFVATKVHEIMDGSEPATQLKTLEMVNKILLKSEEENEEMKKLLEQARTPSVVINIASPFSQENKSHLDILIPS